MTTNIHIPTLADKTLLIAVNISRFSGGKKDKKATEEVNKDNKVQSGNARVWKSLFRGESMNKVTNAEQKIRQCLYKNSSPWDGNFRIIKIENYVKVKLKLEELMREFNAAVKELVDSYDVLLQEDKIKLGNLYNPSDYPSKSAFIASFSAKILVDRVNKTDFRSNVLSQEDVDEINAETEKRFKEYSKDVERDLLNRVSENLVHLLERLGKSDGRFHESNIDNVVAAISEARELNINDNPKIDALFDKIEESMDTLSPEVIREKSSARSNAIFEATKCVTEISTMMAEFDV